MKDEHISQVMSLIRKKGWDKVKREETKRERKERLAELKRRASEGGKARAANMDKQISTHTHKHGLLG